VYKSLVNLGMKGDTAFLVVYYLLSKDWYTKSIYGSLQLKI
jgi:hypothetical protein